MLIDPYSGLNHKRQMDPDRSGDQDVEGESIPSYYSDLEKRRLMAYLRLGAMVETVSRRHLRVPEPADGAADDETAEEVEDSWREFGDPALFTDRMAAAVLGEDYIVQVNGADDPIPSQPPIPPAPRMPNDEDESVSPEERAVLDEVFKVALAEWTVEAEEIRDDYIERIQNRRNLRKRQDELRDWVEKDGLLDKIHTIEHEYVVPLGEAVITIGWDGKRGRPATQIFGPDVYMPVLDLGRPGEFPRRVDLVWEWTDEGIGDEEDVDYVRRITYELVPLDPAEADALDIDTSGVVAGETVKYLAEGEEQTDTCLYTDAVYEKDDFEDLHGDGNGSPVYQMVQLGDSDAPIEAQRIPIGLDFIPVVHVKNEETDYHFGRSPLTRLAQLFDEINGTDTDESQASQWAARPPVAVTGLGPNVDSINLQPGRGMALADGGNMHVVDVARNLSEILARNQQLRKLAAVNISVPEGIIGRVDADDVPSGIAFALSFTSFQQRVERMRRARRAKYPLLLKFAQRIAIQNGAEDFEPEVYPASIHFGPFMPNDLISAANILKLLADAKVLSPTAGLRFLEENGFELGDHTDELASIRAGLTQEALEIFEATGDRAAARAWLQLSGEGSDLEIEKMELQFEAEAERAQVAARAAAQNPGPTRPGGNSQQNVARNRQRRQNQGSNT